MNSEDNSTPQKRLPRRLGGKLADPVTARQRFLVNLQKHGNVTQACRYARINRQTAYDWRAADEGFAAQWRLALEDASELLEQEARRRAVVGVKKPVYQGGEKVGEITEYSDTLLIFLLKAANPEKYRENVRHEHTGEQGGPISIQFFTFNAVAATLTDGSAEDR